MKKSMLFSLLVMLSVSACTNTSSIVSTNSSTNSNTSSSISEEVSSSSSSQKTPTKNIVDVKIEDLEFEETLDKNAYLITKYNKFDKYIRLPETYNGKNIIGIKEGSFKFSGGVEDIYFPDTYTEFDQTAFTSCSSIKNYFVNDTHSVYKTVDGVLYSKDLSTLALYPLGRRDNYQIVEGTKKILKHAFDTSNVVEVAIPESVEEIEEYAFYNSKRLKRINIPSKVKEIKESTFDTCAELKYITFSEGLEKVGYRSFWQCGAVALDFPSTLRIIGESAFEGVGSVKNLVLNEGLVEVEPFAFAYNEYIETITFPSTLKVIGEYAFMQNYEIEELIFNEGLVELKEGAFFYNCNLRRISLPSTLQTIGFNCFVSSEHKSPNGIEEITVNENSEYFTVDNYVLYSKDKTELVYALINKAISGGNFVVPDGVEKIGDHAFYNMSSLRSITLPTSLKEIGKAPFYITSLNQINYLGTIEEFKSIKKEVEVFSSQTSTDTLEVYWYQTNEGTGVSVVNCIDGELPTSEA